MIKGMTGFGSAEISFGRARGLIEVKSVNHRYLDISYYLPPGLISIESKIRDLLQGNIERGRITAAVKIVTKPTQAVSFNKAVAQRYLQQARLLRKELGLTGDLPLSQLIQLPGVIDATEETVSADLFWPAIEKGIRRALASVLDMRSREGKSLYIHVSGLLNRMLLQIKKIK